MRHAMLAVLLLLMVAVGVSQTKFRVAAFPRHSTGLCLWNRSLVYSGTPPPTTIPSEVSSYNTTHGYMGINAVRMDCDVNNATPDTMNNWDDWASVFEGTEWASGFQTLMANYNFIIVKTGYIATQMMSYGSPYTLSDYQSQWRRIVKVMAQHPDKFFVITTDYPAATDGHSARDQQSNLFCQWAKDTLATGKDSYGPFPRNVYVLDWFHYLASSVDGYCLPIYGTASDDDHPSNEAVGIVDPLFVKEVFDAAIAYENLMTDVGLNPNVVNNSCLEQNYPNPFNPITLIQYTLGKSEHAKIVVTNILGQTVFETSYELQTAGPHQMVFDGSRLASGNYIYTLQTETYRASKRLVLLK